MKVGKESVSSLPCVFCAESSTGPPCPGIISTAPRAAAYRRPFPPLFLNDHLNNAKEVGIAFLGRSYCAFSCVFPGDCIGCWEINCKRQSLPGLSGAHDL